MACIVLLLLMASGIGSDATGRLPDQKSLVFRRVTIIDGTGASARGDMTLVITGNRIKRIGKEGTVAIPDGAQVIDASGKYIVPGLWDMHVHKVDDAGLVAPLFVANGITSVRDMHGNLGLIQRYRKQILEGKLTGPRIFAAGPVVDGPKPTWPNSIPVANAADGRQAVGTLKARGADFIKVYDLIPRDGYLALAAEAKLQGVTFAGHVPVSVSAAEASDAGQRSIEHLLGVPEACSSREEGLRKELAQILAGPQPRAALSEWFLKRVKDLVIYYDEAKARALYARFVRNGTVQVPTLVALRALAYAGERRPSDSAYLKYLRPFERLVAKNPKLDFRLKGLTAQDVANLKEYYYKQIEMVRDMHRAGVEVLAGSDSSALFNIYPGFSLHEELSLLVEAGLTPMEALQSATRNPARFFGLLDTVGTIEEGKIADLLMLNADPLKDITNTSKIDSLVLNGRLLDRKALDELLGVAEAAANKT
jgi:hypothetical protein